MFGVVVCEGVSSVDLAHRWGTTWVSLMMRDSTGSSPSFSAISSIAMARESGQEKPRSGGARLMRAKRVQEKGGAAFRASPKDEHGQKGRSVRYRTQAGLAALFAAGILARLPGPVLW